MTVSNRAIKNLVAHRAEGVKILNNELKLADTDKAAAAAVTREREWTAALLGNAEPFGPVFVGRLEPLGEIGNEETRLVWDFPIDAVRSNDHFWSLVTLAVRLHRIEKKLNQIDTATGPTPGPGRPASARPLAQRGEEWAKEIARRPQQTTIRATAEQIAQREGIDPITVEREARRAKKAAGNRGNFPRR